MVTVPRPYPKEFRDDVVNVARNLEPASICLETCDDRLLFERVGGGVVRQVSVRP
jgi:hypothetical protein